MFGKRCQLCGGKLIDNKCTLCGLDNSKSDANYKLNESSCESQPLTHVHTEEPQKENKKKSKNKVKANTKSKSVKTTKKSSKKWGAVLVIIIFLFNTLQEIDFSDLFLNIEDMFSGIIDNEENYDIDWYEDVTRELSASGESYEVVLEPGTYIVGVHIPEGTYRAEEKDTFSGFYLDDNENRIFRGESFNDDEKVEVIDDIRCYKGAKLEVRGKIRFSSKNAQTADMEGTANSLTESVEVKNGDIAGVDFPAGTYDIVMKEGDTSFAYIVPGTVRDDPDDDYEDVTERVWINTYSGEFVKRNLYLPEGTNLHIEKGKVNLVPSEKIPESYEGYYYIYE